MMEQQGSPTPSGTDVFTIGISGIPRTDVPTRKDFKRIMVVVESQANLLEVVLALRPAGRFPSLLNRWQEQRNQDTDDRDDNQQFNQRKPTGSTLSSHEISPLSLVILGHTQ
jgi:hypothetical protein